MKIKAESASNALSSPALLGRINERFRRGLTPCQEKSAGTKIERKIMSPRRDEVGLSLALMDLKIRNPRSVACDFVRG